MPGAWQGSYKSTNLEGTGMPQTRKRAMEKGIEPQPAAPEAEALPLGQQDPT